MLRSIRRAAAAAAAVVSCALGGFAIAQQLSYGFNLTLPLVAETPSYQSTVFLHNASAIPMTVGFTYIGASTSATPGLTTCANVEIAPGTTIKTSVAGLCTTLGPGSNFGVLTTTFMGGGGPYALYSRVQTPGGNGFSVDGMTDNGGEVREVIGLVRQAALPTYQSNCFVLNQETRAGRVVVTLATGDGQPIASQILDLQASQFVRLLDVFAALNATPGDHDNVRATFESIVPLAGGSPVAVIASCTVQNNTSFDADFRIAKGHF